MVESQASEVKKVDIVAESDFVDVTTSKRSAGFWHGKIIARRTVHQATLQSFLLLKILRLRQNSAKLTLSPLLPYHPSRHSARQIGRELSL
jgi:hypothetical protein